MPIYYASQATPLTATAADGQQSTGVANLAYGGWVAVWATAGDNYGMSSIHAQRYDSTGQPNGGEIVVAAFADNKYHWDPVVTGTSYGGFVVTWTGRDADDTGAFMRGFNSYGQPMFDAKPVTDHTQGSQGDTSTVALPDGAYLVTWTDTSGREGSGAGVYVRKFNFYGEPLTDDILVNTTITNSQLAAKVTALPGGGFAVTWFGSTDNYDAFVQRFDASGAKVGEEVRITATPQNTEFYPNISAMDDGGYLVTWQDAPHAGGLFVRGQRYDAQGNAVGDRVEMVGGNHAVAGLFDGGFAIAAVAGSHVVVQRYDAEGQEVGEPWVASHEAGDKDHPAIALLNDGSFVVSWDQSDGHGNYRAYQARFSDEGMLGEQADRVMGSEEADYFEGFGGNDDLYGAAGDDVLEGGAGADRLFGGEGHDEATFLSALGAVAINLQSGGHGGDAAGDRFESIEQFTLSRFGDRFTGSAEADTVYGMSGDDSLVGGGGDDYLDGGVGDDLLEGGLGADMLVGSEGVDEVSYLRETASVIVDIGGRRSQGAAAGDSYQSIERFTLTRFNDAFLGGGDADRVMGGAGNDMLSGLGGDDVLDGGIGDDAFDGGAGNDTLTGGAGNDALNGATGADLMYGGAGNDRYVVDDAGDVVVESGALDGTDRVEASINYLLGDHVETLFLTGSATIAGTGNALANTIVGNGAGNVIDGGAGADLMEGKAGNDRYLVDNIGDKVLEADGAGNDTVEASVSFSLAGQYVETLRLTGTTAINGTGNGQANSLFGNAAANKLNGGTGDDKLHGGAGKDELTGGLGLDRFVFDSALNGVTNVDRILDFNVADDGIYLDRSVFKAVAAGALSASAFAAATAAADAGDRIVHDQASGNIWYDADGSGAGAAVLFASVTAGTALTAADFIAF